jgi:decaprenylphospho-beta-D-erythro-pentofuranosid-2-ulose 2-reductase
MTPNPKKIVIIGATSAIAEHCARLWMQQEKIELILIARNMEKLQNIATDLLVRNPNSTIRNLTVDFLDPSKIQDLVENIFAQGPVDIALIAHGWLPDQSVCQQNMTICQEALQINGVSPVLFAEALVKHMQKINHGTLAIIGSVAGDRGRKTNYIYGAAKSLLASYAQGLQHRLAGTNVKVILIKPGPTATPMTLSSAIPKKQLAPVDKVAQFIVKEVSFGKPLIYVPKKWRIIMLIVRNIPSFIFNKLNF